MSYNLFLDDQRKPVEVYGADEELSDAEWVVVRSYGEFLLTLQTRGIPDLVSFDYDLKSGNTGLTCIDALILECSQEKVPLPRCLTHSSLMMYNHDLQKLLEEGRQFLEEQLFGSQSKF